MEVQYEIQGGDFSTAGQASSEIKKLLKQFNIDPQIVRRIAIALFEAEVNVVAHAYKGIMKADIEPESIRVIVEDEGPGIEDIEKLWKKGSRRHRKRFVRWDLAQEWDCPISKKMLTK